MVYKLYVLRHLGSTMKTDFKKENDWVQIFQYFPSWEDSGFVVSSIIDIPELG